MSWLSFPFDEGVGILAGFGGSGIEGIDLGQGMLFERVTDESQFFVEVLIGEGAGVLEITQALVGEDMEVTIGDEGFEGTAAIVRLAMFGVIKPTKEILRTVVKWVIDEVVTMTEIGFAFAVFEDFSFPIEDLAHEDMTCFIAFLTVR